LNSLQSTKSAPEQQEIPVKTGDHVKIIGRDGFYVFLKEVEGIATLRSGGAKSPDDATMTISIHRVISLEPTK
jgi:hypothetical protein